MIQTIVEYLNLRIATLGRIADLHGITERRKREGDGALVPYCYVGSGEFRPVELDNGNVGWWRGRSGFTMDPVQVIGRAVKQQRASYPLRFVAVLRRELSTSDDAFMPSRLAEDIANALNFDNGDIVSMLKAINVESRASGGEYDAATIWPTEFHTSIPDLRYDLAMVAIDVTIEVVGKYSCWEGECATDPDILRLFNFCDPSVIARLTDTQVTCLESAICEAPLPCADATVTVNTTPFGTAPSGGGLNVPVVNGGSNPVGAIQSGQVVIANNATFINGVQVTDQEAEVDANIFVTRDGVQSGIWNAMTQTWEVTSSGASVSVAVSDAIPDFGDTITITATPSNFTPVRYFCEIRQGTNLIYVGDNGTGIFNYTVDVVGSLEVYVYADDGATVSAFNIGGTATFVAFSPLSLSSPVAGYDASDASSVTIATGVSAITNQVGGGLPLSQASGTSQPAYLIAYKNGLNAIKFDGINDFLASSAALLSGNDWYVSIACRPESTAAIQSIFSQFTSGQDGRMTMNANQNVGGSVAAGRMNPFISPSTGLLDFAFTTASHVIEFESAFGVLSVRFNGTVVATGSTAVAVRNEVFRLGSLDGASGFFSGHFYELWLFNASQTTANKNALLLYYQNKWNI